MHILTIIKTLGLAAAFVSAQSQWQSGPFNLAVSSSKRNLNGSLLGACHVGALWESACVYDIESATPQDNFHEFRLNYSSSNSLLEGYLIWNVPLSGDITVFSSPAKVEYEPGSNLAWLSFVDGGLEDADIFSFEDDNLLTRPGPAADSDYGSGSVQYHRWYLCDYQVESYTYSTLCWVSGAGRPDQGKNCEKIDIIRSFV